MTLIACPRWLPQFRIPFHFDAVWLALSLMDLVARPCYIFLTENDITFLHIFIQFKTCLDFESRWVRGRCWSCLVNDVNLFIASIITWLQDFKLFQNGFQHEWKWLAAFLVSFPGNMFKEQQQHCSWPILTTYSANDMTFELFATGLDELLDWIQFKLIDFWSTTTFDLVVRTGCTAMFVANFDHIFCQRHDIWAVWHWTWCAFRLNPIKVNRLLNNNNIWSRCQNWMCSIVRGQSWPHILPTTWHLSCLPLQLMSNQIESS